MGQYFRFVNPEKKEWIELPSLVKLPEMMSTPIAAQVVMYTLFEGPFDGTTLLDRLYDENDPKVVTASADWIDREAKNECELFQKDDRLERYLRRAIRDADIDGYPEDGADLDRITEYPDEVRENFAELVADRCASVYRNDDLTWDYASIKRVVCAGFKTGEDAMCGRWAGNRIRIIGDYADRDYYDAMYGTVYVEDSDGNEFSWSGMPPEHVEPVENDKFAGTSYRFHEEDAEPGQTVKMRSSVDSDDDFGIFIRYEESEWDDITDDVFAEMARYMPDQFGELLEENEVDAELAFGTGANA